MNELGINFPEAPRNTTHGGETVKLTPQQRTQYIEQHGEVQAIDLPDTKLEVRQQAIQEYKDKLNK